MRSKMLLKIGPAHLPFHVSCFVLKRGIQTWTGDYCLNLLHIIGFSGQIVSIACSIEGCEHKGFPRYSSSLRAWKNPDQSELHFTIWHHCSHATTMYTVQRWIGTRTCPLWTVPSAKCTPWHVIPLDRACGVTCILLCTWMWELQICCAVVMSVIEKQSCGHWWWSTRLLFQWTGHYGVRWCLS